MDNAELRRARARGNAELPRRARARRAPHRARRVTQLPSASLKSPRNFKYSFWNLHDDDDDDDDGDDDDDDDDDDHNLRRRRAVTFQWLALRRSMLRSRS